MPLPTIGVGRSLLNPPPAPAGDPIADALLAATVRWHKFESAALTADEMGGTALTNINGVTATPGAIGDAALFTLASSNYLSLATPTELLFGDTDFSIAFAVRSSNWASNTGGFGLWNSAVGFVFIGASWNASKPGFTVAGPGGRADVYLADTLQNDTTYRFYVWHDAANDEIGIRVNNTTQATAALSDGLGTPSSTPFLVGRYDVSISSENGWYDELRFFDRLLSPAEITRVDQDLSGA